jgi:hypothetical protein
MNIKTCLLSLSFALLVGTAAAQTQLWPIVNGHQAQPTEQEVESREGYGARAREARVQSDIDGLYEEIIRAAAP